MVKTASGTVHGRTIELDDDIGIADGQKVDVVLRFVDRESGRADPWIAASRLVGAVVGESAMNPEFYSAGTNMSAS